MTLITQLSTPETIETALSSGWNTGVIAKPVFEEAFLGERQQDGNTILIGWMEVPFTSTDLGVDNDEINNQFEIAIFADTRTNAIKILSETRRILNKQITSGQWHLDTALPIHLQQHHCFICRMTETIYSVGD